MEKTKEAARQFIENDGHCVYRYGFAYRGAGARTMSKEEALRKLPNYSFGMGFYSLDWINNGNTLEFNELSENDMW